MQIHLGARVRVVGNVRGQGQEGVVDALDLHSALVRGIGRVSRVDLKAVRVHLDNPGGVNQYGGPYNGEGGSKSGASGAAKSAWSASDHAEKQGTIAGHEAATAAHRNAAAAHSKAAYDAPPGKERGEMASAARHHDSQATTHEFAAARLAEKQGLPDPEHELIKAIAPPDTKGMSPAEAHKVETEHLEKLKTLTPKTGRGKGYLETAKGDVYWRRRQASLTPEQKARGVVAPGHRGMALSDGSILLDNPGGTNQYGGPYQGAAATAHGEAASAHRAAAAGNVSSSTADKATSAAGKASDKASPGTAYVKQSDGSRSRNAETSAGKAALAAWQARESEKRMSGARGPQAAQSAGEQRRKYHEEAAAHHEAQAEAHRKP